jgi:hypothetical protein
LLALIGRIFVVLLAFLVASFAAGAVMTFAYLPPGWVETFGWPGPVHSVAIVTAFTAFVVASNMLLPAILVIAIAEGFRLRSILLYAIVGGASGLVSYYGGGPGAHPEPSDIGLALPREAEIVAAAGILAGLVYWALAGRNAGRWQRPRATDQGRARP